MSFVSHRGSCRLAQPIGSRGAGMALCLGQVSGEHMDTVSISPGLIREGGSQAAAAMFKSLRSRMGIAPFERLRRSK
jgi:hypothetical protein